MRRAFLLALAAILPVAALLAAGEIVARVWSLDRPGYSAGGFGAIERNYLVVEDPELGWASKRDARLRDDPARPVTTNSLGLRCAEVPAARGDEYRILSLGESTTFGIGVGDDETYSARLETLLQGWRGRPVRVINAGVSAYSSTQSLLYLQGRGLRLEPDLVLFYHEINDYLPASIRDTGLTELEVTRTDRQLYASALGRLSRALLARSALYRAASYAWARRLVGGLKAPAAAARPARNPLLDIGFPNVGMAAAGITDARTRRPEGINTLLLGRRVTDAERLENLRELRRTCAARGVRLVVIHPAYTPTARHECILTRFCREEGVPMIEAYDALHPAGAAQGDFFIEGSAMHPNARGHAALAGAIARALREQPGLGPAGPR
jgi:lysophospholipase L1-like esterase